MPGEEGPCVLYGLFEWKKSVGHVLCKIVREYYDFFFAMSVFLRNYNCAGRLGQFTTTDFVLSRSGTSASFLEIRTEELVSTVVLDMS